jgi:hypothetical protein
MKKISALSVIILSFIILLPQVIFADTPSPSPQPTGQPQDNELSFEINGLPIGGNPSLNSKLYTDPKTRIDGNTRIVWVSFTGLNPSSKYSICSGYEKSSCFNNFSPQPDGTITLSLCGAGEETAKGIQVKEYGDKLQLPGTSTLKGTCDETRDYFHEDKTYKISLWANYTSDDDKPDPGKDGNETISAKFYVYRSFPLVRIASKNPTTQTIDITLWGRRPQSNQDNNYQVVLQGIDHDYKKEQCFTVPKNGFSDGNNNTVGINTQWVPASGTDSPHPDHILEGTGFGVPKRDEAFGDTESYGGDTGGGLPNPLPIGGTRLFDGAFGSGSADSHGAVGIGKYIVKINERKNDSRPLGIGNQCEGGYTYMNIYFDIDWADRTQGKQEIVIKNVVYDPNSVRYTAPPKPPQIPCAKDSFDKDTGTCNAFDVALLGKIPLDPLSFIKSVYTLVLSIAGVAALLIIIRSGYKFLYSRGDKEIIADARSQLTSAIIGLAFIIFAYVILSIIGVDILKIPGFG